MKKNKRIYRIAILLCTAFIITSAQAQYIYTFAGGGGNYEVVGALTTSIRPTSLCTDSNGNVYFTEQERHSVRMFDRTTGTVTTIAGMNGGGFEGDGGPAIAAKLNEPRGLALDTVRNILYVGDFRNNRIRSINLYSGHINTFAGKGSMGYTGDGGQALDASLSVNDIALDQMGSVIFTDISNHVIRKIDNQGTITTIAGNGTNGSSGDNIPAIQASLKTPHSLLIDISGSIYFTDPFNSNVRKISTDGMLTTIAGTGISGFSGDGGLATNAKLISPEGIAMDDVGSLYISDRGAGRIRKVDDAGVITTYAGNGVVHFQADNVSASNTSSYPLDITFSNGNLIAAEGFFRIREINSISKVINTVVGNGSRSYEGDYGPAMLSQLYKPSAIVEGLNNDLFIVDELNYCIRKIDLESDTIVTYIGNGRKGFSSDGVQADNAQLSSVEDIAIGPDGDLYLVEGAANRIRKIDAQTMLLTTVAGTGANGFGGDGGAATAAVLSSPKGICIDQAGNIFISDNNRIRRIDATTKKISTIAGTGSYGNSGDGGPATQALLYFPSRLAIDKDNNIFFSDNSNHKIRRIDPMGIITTVAGTGVKGFSGDGQNATQAQLNFPLAVSVDPNGNVYIADTQNSRIRKIDVVSGKISTIAGNPNSSNAADGLLATDVPLNQPEGILFSKSGKLYIADTDNDLIKVVSTKMCEISFLNTISVYDGNEKSVVTQTEPSGLSVLVTYDGSATKPVLPGTYAVKALSQSAEFPGVAYAFFTITKAPQVISFPVLGSKALADQSFTINANASSGLPVSFVSGDISIVKVSGYELQFEQTGATTITAFQPGDDLYLPAVPVQQQIDIVDYLAILEADAETLAFGDVALNATATHKIVLSNEGNHLLAIDAIEVPDGFSTSTTALEIEPGQSIEVMISFSPNETITYQGELELHSNATSGISKINLSGRGVVVTSASEKQQPDVKIFPNPFVSKIQIEISDTHYVKKAHVISLDGKKVDEFELLPTSGNSFEVDLSNLPEGIYMINILGTSSWSKILKQ